MKYVRTYAGPDGESHVEDVEIDGPVSERIPGDRINFRRLTAGSAVDWHCAQRRQFVITLAGEADIVASDGTLRAVSPGTAMLEEDVSGKGHRIVVGKSTDQIMMIVSLAADKPESSQQAPVMDEPTPERPDAAPLRIPRVTPTADGGTRFEEIEVAMLGGTKSAWQGLGAGAMRIVRGPAGTFVDWHTERRRQFVITLSGGGEIVTTDGERRRVRPGTVMLFEDVTGTGTGHQTIVDDSSDRILMVIPLAREEDGLTEGQIASPVER